MAKEVIHNVTIKSGQATYYLTGLNYRHMLNSCEVMEKDENRKFNLTQIEGGYEITPIDGGEKLTLALVKNGFKAKNDKLELLTDKQWKQLKQASNYQDRQATSQNAIEMRPEHITTESINLFDAKYGKDTGTGAYYGMSVSQLEMLLVEVLENTTRTGVPGRRDEVVDGQRKIFNTDKSYDRGSLTMAEGIQLILEAARYGVHPLQNMDVWVQKAGSGYNLVIALNYDIYISYGRTLYRDDFPDDPLRIVDHKMTPKEMDEHGVNGKGKVGWVTELWSTKYNVCLGVGYGEGVLSDHVNG